MTLTVENIKKAIHKSFPNATVDVSKGTNLSSSFLIQFALLDRSQWKNGIFQNDPLHTKLLIFEKGDDQYEILKGNRFRLYVKPPEGANLVYGREDLSIRKKTASGEEMLKYIEVIFKKLAAHVKKHKESIKNYEDIPAKFFKVNANMEGVMDVTAAAKKTTKKAPAKKPAAKKDALPEGAERNSITLTPKAIVEVSKAVRDIFALAKPPVNESKIDRYLNVLSSRVDIKMLRLIFIIVRGYDLTHLKTKVAIVQQLKSTIYDTIYNRWTGSPGLNQHGIEGQPGRVRVPKFDTGSEDINGMVDLLLEEAQSVNYTRGNVSAAAVFKKRYAFVKALPLAKLRLATKRIVGEDRATGAVLKTKDSMMKAIDSALVEMFKNSYAFMNRPEAKRKAGESADKYVDRLSTMHYEYQKERMDKNLASLGSKKSETASGKPKAKKHKGKPITRKEKKELSKYRKASGKALKQFLKNNPAANGVLQHFKNFHEGENLSVRLLVDPKVKGKFDPEGEFAPEDDYEHNINNVFGLGSGPKVILDSDRVSYFIDSRGNYVYERNDGGGYNDDEDKY